MSASRSWPVATLMAVLSIVSTSFADSQFAPRSSDPQHLHPFKGFMYFTADDGIHGRELWRCDAKGNAELLKDITPGAAGTEISKFSALEDVLLFRVDPAEGGSELWRTNGTTNGTLRVKQFNADLNEGFDEICGIWEDGRAFLRVVAGSAAFWVTDGTEAGTHPLPMTMSDGTPVGADFFGLVHNGAFHFSANHPTRGPILARCDKNGENVVEIDQLKAPAAELFELDQYRLLFRSSDSLRSQELFISGGTALHTHALFDIAPGPAEGFPSEFKLLSTLGERPVAIFTANDGVHGSEPWVSDGTPDGTRMVVDILPGPESARPGKYVVDENRVVFVATGPEGKELWMGSLPFVTAELLADVRPGPRGSDPYALCLLPKHGVFFSAFNDATGEELYFADASRREVRFVRDIYPGKDSAYPYYTVPLVDVVVFAATDPVHGRELWCANDKGEARLLADIYVDDNVNPSSSPEQLTPIGDSLYFVANDVAHGAELWITDGSDGGTRLVKDLLPGRPGSAPKELTPVGDMLYFTAEGPDGFCLWRSNGTAESTLGVEMKATHPHHLIAQGDTLYFCATFIDSGTELWKVQAEHGATIVRDIAPGTASSKPRNLVLFQDMLYFLADDGIHGEELWRSDGTPEGTTLVRDIVGIPFEKIGYNQLTPAPRRLFFAGTSSQGTELWQFQEETDRPKLVKDVAQWEISRINQPVAPDPTSGR